LDGESLPVTTERAGGHDHPFQLDDGSWAAPLHADGHSLGILVCRWRGPVDEVRLGGLARVGQAMAAHLAMRKAEPDFQEGRLRAELLSDLLSAPPPPARELRKRARQLAVDLDVPYVVVISRPTGTAARGATNWVPLLAARLDGLVAMREDSVAALVPVLEGNAKQAARRVADETSRLLNGPLITGASRPASGPAAVSHAYQEARRCVAALTVLGADATASVEDLGFVGLLLAEDRDVPSFLRAALGPVVDHDDRHTTELLPTLDAYFAAGGSPAKAAQSLHVHPNTVARRLDRITDLLGAGWRQPDAALELHLALRLYRIREAL
jgi:sugar diacid utilization regulator